jgi:hypothetical protein
LVKECVEVEIEADQELENAISVPVRGEGFRVPPLWEYECGVPELVLVNQDVEMGYGMGYVEVDEKSCWYVKREVSL